MLTERQKAISTGARQVWCKFCEHQIHRPFCNTQACLPIVECDSNNAHVVSIQHAMTEANALPGSHQGSCTPDNLSEEIQIHGVPLAGVSSRLEPLPIMLLPKAREVSFDDMIEHDWQHCSLQ